MRKRISCLAVMFVVIVSANAAVAQLTVTTDATQYSQADIVTITIRNAGPSQAHFYSSPACFIHQLDTMECVYNCTGLPVLWEMNVGETITYPYDPSLDAVPDAVGWYRVGLTGTSIDPGSILHCDYRVVETVPNGDDAWGGVKALYR